MATYTGIKTESTFPITVGGGTLVNLQKLLLYILADKTEEEINEAFEKILKKQFDEEGNLVENLPGTRWHYGLIAQELKEVLDTNNLDAAMWAVDGFETDPNGSQSISYDHIVAPLIKSVQQLSETIEILENRLAALES